MRKPLKKDLINSMRSHRSIDPAKENIQSHFKSLVTGIAIAGLLIVILSLFYSCEKEPQYICSTVFIPEQVIAHGHEITIYHKELICDEY